VEEVSVKKKRGRPKGAKDRFKRKKAKTARVVRKTSKTGRNEIEILVEKYKTCGSPTVLFLMKK
jgi:hypothetical protein